MKIVILGRYNVYGRRTFKTRLKYESVYIEYNTKKKHITELFEFLLGGGAIPDFFLLGSTT